MISRKTIRNYRWIWLPGIIAAAFVSALMFYRLGSLTGGLSSGELRVANTAYGWHGLWRQPLYLPLTAVRSLVFVVFSHHGQTLTRLPNALFGFLTVCLFAGLARAWYGPRTALYTALLFTCAAWTLHASRLASNDILYLMTLPLLLLTQQLLQRQNRLAIVFYGSLAIWLTLLFVPGLIWLVILSIFWSRKAWTEGWQQFKAWWQRASYVLLSLPFVAFLTIGLTRAGDLRTWVGLPTRLASATTLLRQFGAVPFHLLIRGPLYPDLWLGRAPVFDVFGLVMIVLGLYFYARHWKAGRTRQLAALFGVSWVLIALNGAVGFSLIIPLFYLCMGAGMAYLLREWLEVFPVNPIARSLGVSLMVVVVALSCLYNLRAYFVAWPHDPATVAEFHQRHHS